MHTVGDLHRNINLNFGGFTVTTNNTTNTNNSTNISGGTQIGNQFAAGSNEFKGTINNITSTEGKMLENLTENLIKALREEKQMDGANPEEVADAVNQVREEAKKKSVNKLSLNGILTGINMVMSNVSNISAKTNDLYTQWHDHIVTLFHLGS